MEREEILELPVMQPDAEAEPVDPEKLRKLFHALSNEHRLRIYRMLGRGSVGTCCGRIEWYEKGCCVTDLVALTGLSQPTVSHHLSVMQESGLVRSEKRGLYTCFFPEREGVRLLTRFAAELQTCCQPDPEPANRQE